jgi:transcriptional regulator with XRE-family HTH domain
MGMTLDRRAELGEFLRSRRARIGPAEMGLPGGGRRRVPGLRREELALLAGVSVDHYVRLEQGRTLRFSESVLDAVARALRLGPVEREHLYRLAQPAPAAAPAAMPATRRQQVRPGTLRLLRSVGAVPAYVIGRNADILAWNDLAAALLTDFGAVAPAERNMARLVLFDERCRQLYEDWPAKVRDVAGYLRLDAARHPADPRGAALLTELLAASPEFRAAWGEHGLKDKTHGEYVYRHPIVGRLQLGFEALRLPADPDQTLVVCTAEEGSPSEIALRLLASWAATVPV